MAEYDAGMIPRLQATLGTAYTLERGLGGGDFPVFVARETAQGFDEDPQVLTSARSREPT